MLRRFEIYSLRDDAPSDAIERLRRALRDCGRFIADVQDSAIGTNRSDAPVQLVWEHAYQSPEAYQRYMAHPFHAAVLDRYLLSDSPERIVADNGLGAGLVGYACDGPVYHQAGGIRRLVLLQLAADASAAQIARIAAPAGPGRAPGLPLRLSVFAENTLATRWFDGVTPLVPRPRWTHLWEQGFASFADLESYRTSGAPLARTEPDAWSGWRDGTLQRAIDVVYEIEPGWGHGAVR